VGRKLTKFCCHKSIIENHNKFYSQKFLDAYGNNYYVFIQVYYKSKQTRIFKI